jgi:hypothetical protein
MDKKISLLKQAQRMQVSRKHQSTYGGGPRQSEQRKNKTINVTHYNHKIDGISTVLCSVGTDENQKVTTSTEKLTCPFCLSILLSDLESWPDGPAPKIH